MRVFYISLYTTNQNGWSHNDEFIRPNVTVLLDEIEQASIPEGVMLIENA